MNKKLIFSLLIVASGCLLASDSQQSTPRGSYTPRPAPCGTPRQALTPRPANHQSPAKITHDTPSKRSVASSDTNGTVCAPCVCSFLTVQRGKRIEQVPYHTPKDSIVQVLTDHGINVGAYHILAQKTRKHLSPYLQVQSVHGVLLEKRTKDLFAPNNPTRYVFVSTLSESDSDGEPVTEENIVVSGTDSDAEGFEF